MPRYKRVLVTGGAGFIGSHIVEALLRQGSVPIVIDDLSVGRREDLPAGVELIVSDVRDLAIVDELVEEVDAVIHLAAKVTIRGSVENFVEDAGVNISGTLGLLRSIAKSHSRPKLIFASSMAVYGEADCLPIHEGHPLRPTSPYGISKLAGELYCLTLGKLIGFRTIILRYFNTYGPRQAFTPYVGVVTIFIRRLLADLPPIIYGDGEQTRDFVSVYDISEVSVRALESSVDGMVLNIGSGIGTTVNHLATMLARRINPRLQPIHVDPRQEEPGNSVAEITLASRILGYAPKRNLEQSLDEIIDWWRGQTVLM